MRPVRAALLAVALAAPGARADTLAEVRAVLARFPARDAVRAAVTIEVRAATGEKGAKAPPPETAAITVEASAGPDGLTVTAPPALLAALREEKQPSGGGKPAAPALAAPLRETRLEALDELLDAGRALAAELAGATVVRESPDTFAGAPSRLVVLRLDPHLDEEARTHVKEVKAEGRIWLDAGGRPLASEVSVDARFRILLMSAEVHQRARREYVVAGDRLVTGREVREERSSGMGQKGQHTVTITVTPFTVPAAGGAPAAAPAGAGARSAP